MTIQVTAIAKYDWYKQLWKGLSVLLQYIYILILITGSLRLHTPSQAKQVLYTSDYLCMTITVARP